uniref:G-protein coupled receptors family 3 profile domain-containing protein n=1 Tax=Naja naja TaxID=35670 RepID=A0A8C6VLD2_NAJNA
MSGLLLLLLLLFWLLPSTSHRITQTVCVLRNHLRRVEDYYSPGDLIIGGNFTQYLSYNIPKCVFHYSVTLKNYHLFLALVHAVTKINKDLVLLPNITLGFHIYDNKDTVRRISSNSLSPLSTRGRMVPGYKCDKQDTLLSVIGELSSQPSRQMASIFSIFKVPQLGFDFLKFTEEDRTVFPFFFRINPHEFLQYVGLVRLLLHFQWNWVGLVAPEGDNGERFISTLMLMLKEKEICPAFTQLFKSESFAFAAMKFLLLILTQFKAEVIILFGESKSILTIYTSLSLVEKVNGIAFRTVWILTSHWEISSTHDILPYLKFFHGALHFRDHSHDIPEFRHLLLSLNPLRPQGDVFLPLSWARLFGCKIHKAAVVLQKGKKCTGKENLQNLPSYMFEAGMMGESYNIYNAVYAVAHAFHDMHESGTRPATMRLGERISNIQPWQVTLEFSTHAGDEVSFSENGLGSAHYDLLNWLFLHNLSFVPVMVGQMDPRFPPGQDFTINSSAIIWARKLPFARCGMKRCQAGQRRKVPEGKQICCYQCDPCLEGSISNQTASLALSLSVITSAVLVIFYKHRNTPIVKANNRDLTYILLVSLLLCFLCSFLFIGQPGKLTCLFRQTAFAILFSLAVSSALAKTVMVVPAFMATKPGNKARKFLGKPLTNSIVLGCPLVQAVLCVILECHEGSASIFYTVLTYLGFLALITFTAAFLTRKLPDSFNEAKFITFSMLVFCSVWITFLPTYLTTKGKSMVAVEIFSILASGAGLLACIFFPKCYIILLRPNLNCRENLIRNKNL